MLLTKYEHACFTLQKDDQLLITDPGVYTTDLPALDNVTAIIITHEHPDHFDPTALGALIARNPTAKIYAHETITRQLGDTLPTEPVVAGQTITIGPFTIVFYGADHAEVHPDLPVPVNLGIVVNDSFYYPGDSFYVPEIPIRTLALPTAAPWLKLSETVAFLRAVRPAIAFPTHDAIASQQGKELVDRVLTPFAQAIGTTYRRSSGPVEIDG